MEMTKNKDKTKHARLRQSQISSLADRTDESDHILGIMVEHPGDGKWPSTVRWVTNLWMVGDHHGEDLLPSLEEG